MYEVIATVSQMHASGLQILVPYSQPLLAPDRKCLAHFPVPGGGNPIFPVAETDYAA